MEKLVYIGLAIVLVGVVALLGGGWMLHTAINEGNFYKGAFGALACGFGLFCIIPAGGALSQ